MERADFAEWASQGAHSMERADFAEWSHPDVTLPQLLSLVRAFMDMLILASGYQTTGLLALWRPQDVQRALGWASLLEQIMNKIPVSKEGKGSRQALNMALQDMMLEDFFPEGLPKLSCEVLAEARKILIYTMSHALGICNGQVESLIAAAYSEQQDWAVVLQHIRDRFMAVDRTKSISKSIQLATPMLDRILASDNMPCCQQWRQKALTYLLDEKTLYKLSGATVLFMSNEMQWRTALQRIAGQADGSKIAEIAELCCLQLSCHRRSILISKLLKPCGRISCSRKSLILWQSRNHNIQGVKMDKLEAYLWEVLKKKESAWWCLPPILVAAALTKGSPLFNCYIAELSSHMEMENYSSRPEGDMLEDGSDTTDDFFARIWCLQFLENIVHEET